MQRKELLKNMGLGAGLSFLPNLSAGQKTHHEAKAKACIFVFLEGGPSHIDTFDPKPMLKKLHLKDHVKDKFGVKRNSFFVESPFAFKKHGQSGLPFSEHFKYLPKVADELCFYRGCQADSVNHPSALAHMNTGNKFSGDPGLGAWMNYGLGTRNKDLPGHIIMTETYYPQGGANNWSNGYLPASFQGTPLRSSGSPILDLNLPPHITRKHQRDNLDLLAKMNQGHSSKHPSHHELQSRMGNYELAYRMQEQVPDVINLEGEPDHIKNLYGIKDSEDNKFNKQCLLARKLVQSGVRYVQVYSGGWDSHDYLERSHKARIQAADQAIAALIADLKQQGMLEETLVVISGEFGRTPTNTKRGGGIALGRDHNAKAMGMVFAGGGTNAGHIVGATDEIGEEAVEVVHPIRDVHCTMLHLMGLDDNKLTYFHGGRYKQLSQIGGEIIPELLA